MSPRILGDDDYRGIVTVPPEGVRHGGADPAERERASRMVADDERIDRLLIPGECIGRRIRALAGDIAADFRGGPVDLLVVLTGSFIFATDLGRELYNAAGTDVNFHLIKTMVYDRTIGTGREEYRAVTLDYEPRHIEGRDILKVEDIFDRGFTLTWLTNYLRDERKVNSLRICTLIDKMPGNTPPRAAAFRENIHVDYCGFTIPDLWIAGYGMDLDHRMRNLPFIVSVRRR